MWSLLSFVADLFTSYQSYRDQRRTRQWSWAKFLVIIAFAALEAGLILGPMLLPFSSRSFLPTFLVCGLFALANFGWFIPLMRRYKLPGRRGLAHPVHEEANADETS